MATQDGRFVSGNRELLDQFCARVIEAGVPLSRAWLHIRTLHPEFAGVSRIWRRGLQTEERFLDFGFEKWPTYLNSLGQAFRQRPKKCGKILEIPHMWMSIKSFGRSSSTR